MKKTNAFTLIELLIVVAIMGVLAAVGVPLYNNYVEEAKWQAHDTQVNLFKNRILVEKTANSDFFKELYNKYSNSEEITYFNETFTDFKNPYKISEDVIFLGELEDCLNENKGKIGAEPSHDGDGNYFLNSSYCIKNGNTLEVKTFEFTPL